MTRIRSLTLAALIAAPISAEAQSRSQTTEVDQLVVTAAPFVISQDALTANIDILDRRQIDAAPPAGLGDVLSGLPGVRSSFFGPGASRPVIRGLSGPRVLVLTNGVGLIDASTLSPDHQVASDPAEAERIEVLRGPSALAYGGSGIGGVVNVIDGRIPIRKPQSGFAGRFASSVSSVDDGYALSGAVDAAAGPVVLHLDAAKRQSEDYAVPVHPESARQLASEGEPAPPKGGTKVANSGVDLKALGAGLSFVGERGFAGFSVKRTRTTYGVPGHAHEHEDGEEHHQGEESVLIDLEQTRYDARAERELDGPFERLRLTAGYADYEHVEVEAGATGTTFTSSGYELRGELVQRERDGWQGAIGVQGLKRDFDAIGEEALVPRTTISELGAFALQRLDRGHWGLDGGLRIDRRKLDSLAGEADFTNVSVSAGVFYRPAEPWFLGLSLSRNGRAPTEMELFAYGPHVGTRSFEIGDQSLDSEVVRSLEATLHYKGQRLSSDVHIFAARYDSFIDQRPSGQEIDGLPVYRYEQTKADFHGFEVELTYDLWKEAQRGLRLEAAADYVAGDTDLGPPARIPPWSVTGRVVLTQPRWSGSLEVRHVAKQDEVATFELPTDGYTFVNLRASATPFGDRRVTLFAEARNLTNVEAREHASFLKDLVPLPGRNLRAGLSYRF